MGHPALTPAATPATPSAMSWERVRTASNTLKAWACTPAGADLPAWAAPRFAKDAAEDAAFVALAQAFAAISSKRPSDAPFS